MISSYGIIHNLDTNLAMVLPIMWIHCHSYDWYRGLEREKKYRISTPISYISGEKKFSNPRNFAFFVS